VGVARRRLPAQGEIWWALLDPAVGHEQRGDRPVLVLSASHVVRALGLAVSVPLTTAPARRGDGPRPDLVEIPDHGWALPAHVRALSVKRFRRFKAEPIDGAHPAVVAAVLRLWGLRGDLAALPHLD
jgi:mRNA-degrading endonuclease toxin of MazEF toxin-antitoxin module